MENGIFVDGFPMKTNGFCDFPLNMVIPPRISDGTPVNRQIIELKDWPYVHPFSKVLFRHQRLFTWWFSSKRLIFLEDFPWNDCDFPIKKTWSNLHLSRISHGLTVVIKLGPGARMQLPMPSSRSWAYGKATLSLSHSSSKKWHHGSSRPRIIWEIIVSKGKYPPNGRKIQVSELL